MKISDFVTKRRYPPPQKLTLWLLLFSQTLVAQTLQVVTKSIEKTFADPKISKVQLWGERSDIDINTWQRQEIKVVIELTAKHPDRSTAEKDLEVMHYTANQSGKEVLIPQLCGGHQKPTQASFQSQGTFCSIYAASL